MTSRADARAPGFTLIEMIVVLAVLGLAMALVIGRGPLRSETLNARDTADGLASALREARGRAIVENRPISLTLDLQRRQYRVAEDRPVKLPAEGALVLKTTNGQVRGETVGGIRFDPDGSSTGGSVELGQGARKIRIGVDWLTGRVSVVNGP
jgi:general secretion pathway protein H